MKNIRVLAAASLMLAMLIPPVFGQSRPRRVFKPAPETQQPSGTPAESPANPSRSGGNANDRANQIGRPPAPPVLRGPTRDTAETSAPATTADNGPEEYGEGDTIRVDTTLVSLPVSVMDRDGKFIPNLRKEDFHIWENGVEQQVAYFASTEKAFTVALVIDTSGSTKFVLTEIQDAAIAFVEQLRPDDQVMVFSFSDRIRNLTSNGPTSDRFELRDAIRRANVGSGTKLYDAVDLIINQHFNHIPGRKAMVLFTDGVDTTSNRASYETTVRDAEEVDALIYPVLWDTYEFLNGGRWPGGRGGGNTNSSGNKAIDELFKVILGGGINIGGGGGGGAAGTSREEYDLGNRYLHDLARVTGARLYQAENENFAFAFRSVAEELRRQYSLGYYPKNKPNAGERRGIRVRVDRPELVVRTRDSYVFQPRGSAQTAPQPKPPVLRR
jgi:VWFA-related protein